MDELQSKAAEKINELIGEYVKRTGTTKESVMHAMGCSKTAFYQKMSGKAPFSMYEGYTLSKLLGCSVSSFFEEAAES